MIGVLKNIQDTHTQLFKNTSDMLQTVTEAQLEMAENAINAPNELVAHAAAREIDEEIQNFEIGNNPRVFEGESSVLEVPIRENLDLEEMDVNLEEYDTFWIHSGRESLDLDEPDHNLYKKVLNQVEEISDENDQIITDPSTELLEEEIFDPTMITRSDLLYLRKGLEQNLREAIREHFNEGTSDIILESILSKNFDLNKSTLEKYGFLGWLATQTATNKSLSQLEEPAIKNYLDILEGNENFGEVDAIEQLSMAETIPKYEIWYNGEYSLLEKVEGGVKHLLNNNYQGSFHIYGEYSLHPQEMLEIVNKVNEVVEEHNGQNTIIYQGGITDQDSSLNQREANYDEIRKYLQPDELGETQDQDYDLEQLLKEAGADVVITELESLKDQERAQPSESFPSNPLAS